MSVENFLEPGLRKNLPEHPNDRRTELREVAKVFLNVSLAGKRCKPAERPGSRLALMFEGNRGAAVVAAAAGLRLL
jgi:hypothetical protein